MPMQIINDLGAGGRLGAALGTGLQQLAQNKLGQLQIATGLAPVLGKNTAHYLSLLRPEERQTILQDVNALTQLQNMPGQQNIIPQNLLPYQQNQQQPKSQQQITPERAQEIAELFTSPQEKREREKLKLAERRESLKETKPYLDALKGKEKAAKEGDLRLGRMENLIERGNLPNSALWSALTKIEEAPLTGAGAGATAGAALGSAFFPGLGTGAGAAVGGTIGGLLGSLISPFAGAAKTWIKSGSPDVEEFEKLSNDFVKNAKQYFGARLTDRDLKVFMDTIPTLMQTDAGKSKVIENLKSLNELVEIEAKAARSIIKAHGGIPPIDIEQQVQDKIGDKIDKVAKKFIVR